MAAALLLLVTVVMPSEYAIDPTGVGRVLGLTQMGEVKIQLADEAAADASGAAQQPQSTMEPIATTFGAEAQEQSGVQPEVLKPAQASATELKTPEAGQQHEMTITLKPNQGAEVKLEMKEGAKVDYTWSVTGGVVNYDTHGDPYNAPRNFYHGYGKGRATPLDKGTLKAAFDGKHGWFWRNRTDKPVTVTLRTQGNYISIKRVI
ncbi:transmembrane anchor protein [Pseudomonas aeruginosa]|uniref:transmembrane anchor protein n=1 Tax=Pseudomonas aeruginosa TaxID=287 RepID=UPI00396A4DB9